MHRRRVIREAVVAGLVAAGTGAAGRVYDHPWNERTALPAIVVEDIGETQEAASFGVGAARAVERRLLLQVTGELSTGTGWAAKRDDLMADIEAAVAGLVLPGVKAIVPAGYAADEDKQGARPIVMGRQRFEITYFTPMNNPAAATL